MSQRVATRSSTTPPEVSQLSAAQLAQLACTQATTIDSLQQRVDGLNTRSSGSSGRSSASKSQRFAPKPDPCKLPLAPVTAATNSARRLPRQTVITHTRGVRTREPSNDAEPLPFFDETRLPVHTIEGLDPEIAALSPEQYEMIDEKVSYRLAQRPGSYEILKYVRAVVKRRDTQQTGAVRRQSG